MSAEMVDDLARFIVETDAIRNFYENPENAQAFKEWLERRKT